jgi:hypothetical protein
MSIRPLILVIGLGLTACAAPPSTSNTSVSFNSNDVSGVGTKRFSRSESEANLSSDSDRDCDSFSSSVAAQQFFVNAGGPRSDPNDLDRDGDGYACEWGVELKQRAAAAEAAQRRAALVRRQAVRAASRCYTGPRGGTYTLTASGNKNYGGC